MDKEQSKIKPRLKVWHIPQIPMTPFEVEVESVSEAIKILCVLADYDHFQCKHRLKPDFRNAQGLAELDEDGEWRMVRVAR